MPPGLVEDARRARPSTRGRRAKRRRPRSRMRREFGGDRADMAIGEGTVRRSRQLPSARRIRHATVSAERPPPLSCSLERLRDSVPRSVADGLSPWAGGRAAHRFPETSKPARSWVPERLTGRCCSFGARLPDTRCFVLRCPELSRMAATHRQSMSRLQSRRRQRASDGRGLAGLAAGAVLAARRQFVLGASARSRRHRRVRPGSRRWCR